MLAAEEKAQRCSSVIGTATLLARDNRTPRARDGDGGPQVPHSSAHTASVALQCTLHVKEKQQLASWLWKQDREVSIARDSADVLQIAVRGIGFCMYMTAKHELFCSGLAQYVQYEDVRVRSRKRSSAHPSRQPFKSLSSREREPLRRHQLQQEGDTVTDTNSYMAHMLLPAKYQVRQVSCGISHCIVLAGENGECDSLFAWGIGMYGQLGLGGQQVANTMTPIHTSPEFQELLSAAHAPSKSTYEIELRCGPVTTYVFLKHTRIVWHWGLLPSSDSTSNRFVLQGIPIEFPMIDEDVAIADIAVGVEHLVLLSAPGRVFTWGYGAGGQLGLGHERAEIIHENAQQMDFFHSGVTIVAIASGWNHTIALANDHSVYAWGSNRLGACGVATKFHEYFAPVRVSIPPNEPRATNLAADDGDEEHQYAISCCGNTSVLTTRQCSSGPLEAAFVWGMCSDQVAALTPIEVPDVRYHGCFTDYKADYGVLHWIYAVESTDPVQLCHNLLQIQNDSEPSGLASYDLELDEAASLKLVAVLDNSNFAQAKYSTNRLRMREAQISTSADDQQIVQLGSVSKSEQANALDVQLDAICSGTSQVELLYDGNLVFGCPIQVRVRQKRECERAAADSSDASPINICAISVVGKANQGHYQVQPTLADLKWKPATAKRVRIYDDDILELLIQCAQPIAASMLRLEDNFGSEFNAEITIHSCFVGSQHKPATLAAARIQFPGIGVFSIVQAKSDSAKSLSSNRRELAEVICVMNPAAKRDILIANASLLKNQIDRAINSVKSTRANFSAFVSTLLRNEQLRGVLVNTPFVSTTDMEKEIIWDVDREFVNRETLCTNSSDPFVLWRNERIPNLHDNTNTDDGFDKRAELMSFWDVLPRWTLGDPAVVELSLTPVRPMLAAIDLQDASYITLSNVSPADLEEEARVGALRIGLSVQQSPLEFLVQGNLVSNSTSASSLPEQRFAELEMTEVTAWRDQHGELFYTPQPLSAQSQPLRASFAIRVYGHESHHFRETATGSLVGKWKTKMHALLWELLDQSQWSIDDLFQRFLPASAPSAPDTEAEKHIRLRDFVSTLGGLGFATTNSCFPGMSLSKQEWLTLFTEIQSLAAGVSNLDSSSSSKASSSARVTRSVFKTFLIDPFHQLFWRHYVDTLQSLASRNAIVQTLLDQFRPAQAADHSLQSIKGHQDEVEDGQDPSVSGYFQLVPWSEFVEYLFRFHSAMNRIRIGDDQDPDQHNKKPVLSVLDYCRILYRFDLRCDGWISARLFQQSVVASLRDTKKGSSPEADDLLPRTQRAKQRTAVRNAKRPDVDAFSTPNAVQKLFLARAKKQQKPHDGRRISLNSTRSVLVHAGNTHLARIRSLPVSKLLREGVHFRPQLHASDSNSETTVAEQSY